MKFIPLSLDGAYRVDPEPTKDERGLFARIYCVDEFASVGLYSSWLQCNVSCSTTRGTVRGLHFQRAPKAEIKLLRCTKGSIWDVIVDLRTESPTYGNWHGELLDEDNRSMLYVPKGFAHGFQTLTNDVEMFYFHSEKFSAPHQHGLIWNDPEVAIKWPIEVTRLSKRDLDLPFLKDLSPIDI
ncbi:MAG: dTDP-4-dehydrorhamnose 3,5-epimerase [Albidovulum sp.]|nr:dTDP-4-dehydrorhamnose 3,5-epimerase [Albidovulum sp.]